MDPVISVIVPTYKRDCIYACIAALQTQEKAPPFEIIIAAREPDERLLRMHDLGTNIIRCDFSGNGPAKNKAAYFARGSLLAFTDDDCIPFPNWLEHLYKIYACTKADIVIGQCLPGDERNPHLLAHQGVISYFLDSNPPWQKLGYSKALVGTSMNMLVTKSCFQYLQGFNPNIALYYGDDWEFNMRWVSAPNIQACYERKALVYHHHALTFYKLLKLSFKTGISFVFCKRFVKDAPKALTSRRLYGRIWSWIVFDQVESKDVKQFYINLYAAFLAIVMQEVKRLGALYALFNPSSEGKFYD